MTVESSFSLSLRAGPGTHTIGIEQARLDQLLAARLDREVGLGKRNGLLARVAVLRQQVAGVPIHSHVLDRAFRAGSQSDHLRDLTKMVRLVLARRPTGLLGLVDRNQDVAPLGVAEQEL